MRNYLEFEKEIKSLEEEVDGLKSPFGSEGISEVDTSKIKKTQEKINEILKNTYSNLNSWQKTLVARHEDRPRANFYINKIFSKFERNFGMMRPEGYRKCIRLMTLANRFKIPIVTFVDTPGAYPGIGAEQRGQASAIANSIECCMNLTVPNISIIIGEGGSGGAIALASSNKVIMLENSIYSVISPEGCASILWRDPSKSLQAAEAMKMTAPDLLDLGIIDEIIKEPLGGAHRDNDAISQSVKESIINNLKNFENFNGEEIYEHRKNKFLNIGRNKGFIKSSNLSNKGLGYKETKLQIFSRHMTENKLIYLGLTLVILASIIALFN